MPPSPTVRLRIAVFVWAAGALLAGSVSAQAGPDEAGGAWNGPRVNELVERGREARVALARDGNLSSYRASVEGHVYFFLDPDAGERILIRLDQVAVALQWQAPDRLHQHIVGERSEVRLPVQDFNYYLDRLTLVEYGFGDEIRIGGGLDVAGVPHPLALLSTGATAEAPYDFRIADSLSLHLPGREGPLQLFEVEVRPRDSRSPGAIGRLTLEGGSGNIVRMALTFTPASYVDRRTDRISVDIDYGLWEDLYWLPNEQRIEVRREVPEVDLGMGTVIRSVLRAGDYQLNVPLPEDFAAFPSVTAASPAARQVFPFREGLRDGMDRDGLTGILVELDIRALESQLFDVLGSRPPSGLSPLRLHLPRPSALMRYSRAEGFMAGAGISLRPEGRFAFRGAGAVSPTSGAVQGSAEVEYSPAPRWSLGFAGRYRQPADLGLAPASDAILSALSFAVRGEDFRDPWLSSGAELRHQHLTRTGLRLELSAGLEQARHATLAREDAPLDPGRVLRSMRPITEGTFFSGRLSGQTGLEIPGGGRALTSFGVWMLSGRPGTGLQLRGLLDATWAPPSGAREHRARLQGAAWFGDPLRQGHTLIGGRGTVPGHPFRSHAGAYTVAGSLETSANLRTPFVRVRGAAHAGWAGGASEALRSEWGVGGTGSPLLALSGGFGLAWDLIRVDVARGLGGGEWQGLLSIDPRWWDRL